jgi:hypothetical protein
MIPRPRLEYDSDDFIVNNSNKRPRARARVKKYDSDDFLVDGDEDTESEITSTSKKHNFFDEKYLKEFDDATDSELYTIVSRDDISEDYVNRIPDEMCNDSVLRRYLIDSIFLNERSKKSKFDFIFLESASGEICGVIVCQEGECKEYPKIWSVRIICNIGKKCKGGGTFLLGCYMYIIKKRGQPFGLLELSDSIENIAGFCSYSKFGFIPVPEFKCSEFADLNLPMVASTNIISFDQIINISNGGDDYPISRPKVCSTLNKDKQKKKIKKKSKKFDLENAVRRIFDEKEIDKKILKRKRSRERSSRNTRESIKKPKREVIDLSREVDKSTSRRNRSRKSIKKRKKEVIDLSRDEPTSKRSRKKPSKEVINLAIDLAVDILQHEPFEC